VATAATMGSVALPYFEKTAYNQRMVLGSLAGRRCARQSDPARHHIHRLWAYDRDIGRQDVYRRHHSERARVPLVFCCHLVHGLRRPSERNASAGHSARKMAEASSTSCRRLFLILIVLGTIYGGIATPTEAAALGVVAASCSPSSPASSASSSCTSRRKRRPQHFDDRLILFGCVHAELHHDATARAAVDGGSREHSAAAGPGQSCLVIIGFYLALGTFMEGFSMIIHGRFTVVFPVVKGLGYDPIWFGVIVTMLTRSLISPETDRHVVLAGHAAHAWAITDVFSG